MGGILPVVIGRKWTLKHSPPSSSSLFLFFKNGFHKHEKFAAAGE
jgi:hypothetical protein